MICEKCAGTGQELFLLERVYVDQGHWVVRRGYHKAPFPDQEMFESRYLAQKEAKRRNATEKAEREAKKRAERAQRRKKPTPLFLWQSKPNNQGQQERSHEARPATRSEPPTGAAQDGPAPRVSQQGV